MAILPLTRKGVTTVLKQLAKKAIAACGFELHRQRNPVPAHCSQFMLRRSFCGAYATKFVLNVGCAEGFYAVGLAIRLNDAQVFAADSDPCW